jgi:very-short-patch-repair endonuclease
MGTESRAYREQEGRSSPDARIAALAGRQHGVVSTAQMREAGLTKDGIARRVQAKRLYPLHRGVYAVGHEALTWRSHLIAAVYACGPAALASHRAAGALHGLVSSSRIEVTATRGTKRKQGIVVHRPIHAIHAADRTFNAAVPVTTTARTLVDLADVLTEERLAKALHQAEILRVFDLTALEQAQERAGATRGRHRLERVLSGYRPEPHLLRSRAERRLKQLLEKSSLPQPQFNVAIAGYELDAYWPEARFALETDGAETHHTRHAFHADRRRDRALATQGIQVNRVTWPDLNDELTEQVREILARR